MVNQLCFSPDKKILVLQKDEEILIIKDCYQIKTMIALIDEYQKVWFQPLSEHFLCINSSKDLTIYNLDEKKIGDAVNIGNFDII